MSITNYDELKASIASWLNREDLTAVIPDFITLAEAAISRDLRHFKQEKRVTTTADERYENLPNDWLEIQQVEFTSGGVLSSMASFEMERLRAQDDTAGKPRFMRLTADQIEFYPTPDSTYDITMQYYARIPTLDDENTSNWLLRDAPDVLLYGSLVASAPYLNDDARAPVWVSLYRAGIDGLNAESSKARHAGPLTMGVPRNG